MSATDPDQVLRYKGFDVEIEGVDGAPASVDSAWESVTGGTDNSVVIELSPNGALEGTKYVSDLCLYGPMTAGREALREWLRETALGKDARRDVRVTAVLKWGAARSLGETVRYRGCRIVGYEVADMDSDPAGALTERICIAVERAEIA